MINFLKKDRWSAYLVGALIGTLLTIVFIGGYQIGVSGGIARIAAILFSKTSSSGYFQKLLQDQVLFDWRILFVLGLLLGSFIASKISKGPEVSKNLIWQNSFGPSKLKRYIAAFIGGVFLMLGARLAGGCTSGHAISGGAQLSIASWAFMLSVFATAIPFSFLLYRKSRR